MKLFVSILLAAGAAHASNLKLHLVDRVQTRSASVGQPQLIHEKDGSKTLVQVEDLGDKYNMSLAAYGKSGKIIAQTLVRRPNAGEGVTLNEVTRDSAGDLIAILYYNRNTGTEGELESVNINKGTGVRLADGQFPKVLGRLNTNSKRLVLVGTDLGHGPNGTYPELLRVLDEDSGDVISQTLLDNGVSALIGLDSAGQPRALVYGYELLGLIDMLTGAYINLIPPRTQPSFFPGVISTRIGDLLELRDSNSTRLLDINALMNGTLKAIRIYGPDIEFHEQNEAGQFLYAVDSNSDGFSIKDLATDNLVGAPIPAFQNGRATVRVEDISDTMLGLVVVVAAAKNPNSYIPGTILKYYQVKGTKLLRTQISDQRLTAHLLSGPNGNALSVEITNQAIGTVTDEVIDLQSNKVINSGDLLVGLSVQTPDLQIVGLATNKADQVCVVNLLDKTSSQCVDDKLVTSAVQYGYQPMEVTGKEILMPLLGAQSGFSFPSLGYIDFTLN